MNKKNNEQTYFYQSKIKIPTRDEFHREFAGLLSSTDFCTSAPQNHKSIYYTPAELESRRIHSELKYAASRSEEIK